MKILKETIWERISRNKVLFWIIIISIMAVFKLYGTFYTITMALWFPIPMRDKYFIPWDVIADDKMYITSAILWIISFILILYIFKKKFIDNRKENKWSYKWLATIIFWWYIFFLLVNPWYAWQRYPKIFFYENWKNITNKSLYFFMTERYGFVSTLYKPFRTLEDSIEGLEFANKNNNKSMYYNIFFDLEVFGYDEVLKKYKDTTFQAYFIRMILNIDYFDDEKLKFFKRNIFLLKNLSDNTDNILIRDISNKALNDYKEFISTNDIVNIKELIKKYSESLLKDAWEIKGVNEWVFYY